MKEDSELGDVRGACLVCASSMPAALYPDSRDYITGDHFEVRQCPQCATAWTSPVPSNLEPYYPRSYRRYNAIIISILKFLYRQRVGRWARRLPKAGSALELGCGDGFMLNALRSFGWTVAGTERTEEMARFARDQFGLTVYVESQQPIPAEARFDLVVLFQVLEHLHNPVEELSRAASLLASGGSVIVAVPNFGSWQSRFAKSGWFHLDVPRHLVHLSPESLAQAASKAGLKISTIEFVSFEHDPYGWVQSILNRVFGNGNRLTKLLMRSVPWKVTDGVTLVLATLLTPLAVVLSLFSWSARRGAIMEATLTRV